MSAKKRDEEKMLRKLLQEKTSLDSGIVFKNDSSFLFFDFLML
jgi:hypothetical protein